MSVITRIAPSPTGDMHIGTARTALFNYLYAKHTGGEFHLRIEDTDKERSTKEAVDVIFDSLKWLGLDYDGPAVFQSANADRHREAVAELLFTGGAYKDFMRPEDVDQWKAENRGTAFRSAHRDMTKIETAVRERSGEPFVVRLRIPDGVTVLNDLVAGSITFKNENLDDFVLLRVDGSPTYNLAVVVDDHDLGVTHVIRGDDHTNNTPRQMLIYKALGWDIPAFGHIPLIYNEAGKKLAKRDGAASVMDFALEGYLPEALLNYLARLGWGHGNDEIFSMAQAAEWFDVVKVVSAPARMNPAKLKSINHHYIGKAENHRLAGLVAEVYRREGRAFTEDRLVDAIAVLKDGADTIVKLADLVSFAVSDIAPDEASAKALSDPVVKLLCGAFVSALGHIGWTDDPKEVNIYVRTWAENNGQTMKMVGLTLRAALVGRTPAPDLGSILVALGEEETSRRLLKAFGQ